MKTKSVTLIILFLIIYKINAQEYGTWNEIDSLNYVRVGHAMVVLPNGNVLVSGASITDTLNTASSCEIFDINTQTWRPTNPLLAPMYGHFMEVLNSGEILAFGGATTVCQIFNPNTEEWRLTDSVPTLRNWNSGKYVKLNNNMIMIMGGVFWDFTASPLKTLNNCEIFNPTTETWEVVSPLKYARSAFSATTLNDGRVLVSGGKNGKTKYKYCEIYNPQTNSWTETDSLPYARSAHAQILLENGNVLLIGGDTFDENGNQIEENFCAIFDIQTEKWIEIEGILKYRNSPAAFKITNNQIMLIGGDLNDSWEIYDLEKQKTVYSDNFIVDGLDLHERNVLQLTNKNIMVIGGLQWVNGTVPEINLSKRCFVFDIVSSVTKQKFIVKGFKLFQNYPNPFNPSTLLNYQIPENNYVNLTVYNSLGQTVAELVKEYQSKGKYSVEFDASNLSSGIYFYKIKAGEFSDVKKMLLTK